MKLKWEMSNIRMIGAQIIGITSGEDSFLAQNSDLCQILPRAKEACALNLAPTSSTTVQLVYGDALAVAASRRLGIDENTFALYHPAGALGKRLVLKVKDAMKSPDSAAVVTMPASFRDVVVEMCEKESRIISIVDGQNRLEGIITDGDIRRILKDTDSINEIKVEALMTRKPVCVKKDTLLVDVFSRMRKKNINGFPVIEVLSLPDHTHIRYVSGESKYPEDSRIAKLRYDVGGRNIHIERLQKIQGNRRFIRFHQDAAAGSI